MLLLFGHICGFHVRLGLVENRLVNDLQLHIVAASVRGDHLRVSAKLLLSFVRLHVFGSSGAQTCRDMTLR